MFEELMSIEKTSALSKMKLEKASPEQISPFVVASVKVNFPMNGSVISRTRQRRLAFFTKSTMCLRDVQTIRFEEA